MEELYHAIHAHPEFKKLETARSRLSWILTGIVFGLYFSFILSIAFKPAWLARPITNDSVITWGIPAGLLVIVISFLLTGYYVHRANSRFDPAREAMLSDIQRHGDLGGPAR